MAKNYNSEIMKEVCVGEAHHNLTTPGPTHPDFSTEVAVPLALLYLCFYKFMIILSPPE